MIVDFIGNEIKEKDIVTYAVATGILKVGVVTGLSEKKSKYKNIDFSYPFLDLIQITPLEKIKIQKKWYPNYPGKILKINESCLTVSSLEKYYRIESMLDDWFKNNNHIHNRDSDDSRPI